MSKQKSNRRQSDEKASPVQNITVNSDNGNINTQRHNVDV